MSATVRSGGVRARPRKLDTPIMQRRLRRRGLLLTTGALVAAASLRQRAAFAQRTELALPSWNDGRARDAIMEFVHAAIDPSSAAYVPLEDRIATFDQDGTLWVEQPLYPEAMFALERLRATAPAHPEWSTTQPFAALLAGQTEDLTSLSESDWAHILAVSQAGLTDVEFQEILGRWIATATHPTLKRRYIDLVYQPMLELMDYLRVSGFRTYIVSGGSQDFVRNYSQQIFGVLTDQAVGSPVQTEYRSGPPAPALERLSTLVFAGDNEGKPVGIHMFVGKRPRAAFGNADGDREMLEWTAAGSGVRLKMLLLHDDPVREFAYGPAAGLPDTNVGRFSEDLLQSATAAGWTVISMRNDWSRVFL
jgi:hypothetical protein